MSRLDRFVLEVVLPLAERTNALIVISGLKQHELSASFSRMHAIQKAKYGGKDPFSVVGFVSNLPAIISNDKDDAHWKKLMNGSTAWQKRQTLLERAVRQEEDDMKFRTWYESTKTLQEIEAWKKQCSEWKREHGKTKMRELRWEEIERYRHVWEKEGSLSWQTYDICKHAPCLIVTDTIHSDYKPSDKPMVMFDECYIEEPLSDLKTALIRRVSETLPSISFKTGSSFEANPGLSLYRSIDMMNNSTRVVFLDVVKRNKLRHGGNRPFLIEQAQKAVLAYSERLLKAGTNDVLNVCTIAYFYDVLFGDGDPGTATLQMSQESDSEAVPIHLAIRRLKLRDRLDGMQSATRSSDVFAPATPEQVSETAKWISRTRVDFQLRFWQQKIPDDPELKEMDPEDPDYYNNFLPKLRGETMTAQSVATREIFLHPNFTAVHVANIAGAKRLIDVLCRSSRLPKENSLEALELLRGAWMQHDVAIHLARRYKSLGRILYMLYLMVGLATVSVSSVFLEKGVESVGTVNVDQDRGQMQHILFGLSMLGSVVLLADRFFNPTARGGQLRASAASLESIIWRFRARVGEFEGSTMTKYDKKPDYALCQSLTQWHEELTSGTDLLSTSLDKKYPDKVYTHGQIGGELLKSRSKRGSQTQQLQQQRATQAQLHRLDEEQRKLEAALLPAGHGAPSDAGGGAVAQPSESEAAPGLFASARVVPVVDDDAAEDPTLQNQKMEKVAEIRRKRMQIMEDLEKEEEVACVDDFYSPAEPEAYIELRLQKIITFYQDRIPWFYNWRRFWELVLALCTVASATLSYLSQFSGYVVVATSLAAAVTSWNAHDDLSKRIQRYTSAVRNIERLVWWWRSLDDIERASPTKISLLIEGGESIITAERLAWLSAMRKEEQEKQGFTNTSANSDQSHSGGKSRTGLRSAQ